MKHLPFAAFAAMFAFYGVAHAQQIVGARAPVQASNYSAAVGTTPAQVWPAATATRTFSALINVAPTTGTPGVITCSYYLGASVAPNLPGTFTVVAGAAANEHNTPAFVNPAALWCVSSVAATPLTAVATPN